jgi:hypothetical protein
MIEERLTTGILNMIRSRRAAPSVPESDLSVHCPAVSAPATLREARFSDFKEVAELKGRWGLFPDSLENWERLWSWNPALIQGQVERPIGWVLESDGRVVGYLGNISLLYHYGSRTLTAVTGSGFAVQPPYRALSLSLIAAFYRQKSVDLFLTTSAIEAVGKMARAFKSDPLPQADYETVLFWVLRPYPFAQGLMKKLRLSPLPSSVGATLAAFVFATNKILRKPSSRRLSSGLIVKEIGVHEIGDGFEALWAEKLNESPRLIADRSPSALRWHFEVPGDQGNARVFCCYERGELLGYAVVRSDLTPDGLRTSIIADMLARQDSPAILRALWAAVYDHANRAGSHILEAEGFPRSIREVFSESKPYRRKLPACPFYYKAADAALHKALSHGKEWYATPFDGDTTLMRPSYSTSTLLGDDSRAEIEDARRNAVPAVPERERTEVP